MFFYLGFSTMNLSLLAHQVGHAGLYLIIVSYICTQITGTPDVKRDDSLLPKSFQFAKREKFRSAQPIEECSAIGHEPMVLPVALRAAYWNGGRWCGTTATASQVSVDSGYKSLYREVVQSEHRLVNCKTGKYFLQHAQPPKPKSRESTNTSGRVRRRRRSIVSEFEPRQKTRRPSVAKPYIPPLPLDALPKFDMDEQCDFNQVIISAYRDESTYRERIAAKRRTQSPEVELSAAELKQSNKFGTNGFPLKACENTSLRQLEHILQTKASFRAMQHDLNTKLVRSLKSMETARPYHYAYEFRLKGGGSGRPNIACDPSATPRRADTLREHLKKNQWFEELIEMAHRDRRTPTKAERFIIEDIRVVLDQGNAYTLDEFTNLIQMLGKRKMDMDSAYPEKALMHVRTSLNIDDTDILTNLISARSKLPAWLERKTNLVKQVIRDLSPNRFPMSNWADKSKARFKFQYRPKTPPARKLRKLLKRNYQSPPPKKIPQVPRLELDKAKAQTSRF